MSSTIPYFLASGGSTMAVLERPSNYSRKLPGRFVARPHDVARKFDVALELIHYLLNAGEGLLAVKVQMIFMEEEAGERTAGAVWCRQRKVSQPSFRHVPYCACEREL